MNEYRIYCWGARSNQELMDSSGFVIYANNGPLTRNPVGAKTFNIHEALRQQEIYKGAYEQVYIFAII